MSVAQELKAAGIHAVLFDLDNTLVATHVIFVTQQTLALETIVRRNPHIDLQALATRFEEYKRESVRVYNVVPDLIWPYTLRNLAEEFSLPPEDIQEAMGIIYQTYQSIPELYEDTIETLIELRNEGIKIAIVTHAESDWTLRKLMATDLLPLIDQIQIASVEHPKLPGSWASAAENLGVDMSQCIVVGDNLKGDIEAAKEAGVQLGILIRKEDGWSHVNEGEVPEGVIVAENLTDGFNSLLNKINPEFQIK
jgi:HAD superfamily hydrolase (TIGR01549 family)